MFRWLWRHERREAEARAAAAARERDAARERLASTPARLPAALAAGRRLAQALDATRAADPPRA